ncbi:hypothetical protein BOTBODRAFT_74233, partial [Botryobasidium botryosum FD-172 SS1]
MKSHLQPLAVAANITQAANARLDQVLLTFGALFRAFSRLTGAADAGARTAVLESIEWRWSKSDHDVFIAALVLNPHIKIGPLNRASVNLTNAALFGLFTWLWERFYSCSAPDSLYSDTMNYLTGNGPYQSMGVYIQGIMKDATKQNKQFDPIKVWEDMTSADEASMPLACLACHLLAICPNSASCERLFSAFGNILTRLCNRTSISTLTNLASLKMHLHLSHVETGAVQRWLQR